MTYTLTRTLSGYALLRRGRVHKHYARLDHGLRDMLARNH
jgi:hypothetical protein